MNPHLVSPQGNNGEPEGSGDSWGDSYQTKSQTSFRFAYQNINGLMNDAEIKMKSLYNHMVDNNIDVFGVTEANTNWTKTSSLQARTLGFFEARRTVTSFLNVYPFPHLYQPGGTFILARDQMAYRSFQAHADPARLGRWSSLTFRGVNGAVTRIVVVYRPVKAAGAFRAYNQQVTALQLVGNMTCPRQQILSDLGQMITQWMEAGEHLIIAMDFNDDVRGEECRSFFEGFGLREVLCEKHGSGPPTYLHSEIGHAVDGIFCNAALATNIRGGYFDVGMGVYKADHRCLWVDIPYTSAFGARVPIFIRPEARRLRCQDPRLVATYTEKVHTAYLGNPSFMEFVQQAENMDPSMVTPLFIKQYDTFNDWKTKVLLKAERECRHLRMGGVPYSPPVTVAMQKIILWKHVLSRVKGGKYSVSYIRRLERRTGVKVPRMDQLTEEIVALHLKTAYNSYREVKKDAQAKRMTFLEDLASAQALAGNTSYSGTLKALEHREITRLNSRLVKAILKVNQGSASLDYVVGPDGIAVYDQAGMCRVLAEENSRRFLQVRDTPFMCHPTLIQDFGRLGVGPACDGVLDGTYISPSNCSRGVKLFLEHVKRPMEVVPISARVPTVDYRRAFKVVQENTSSSFSGIHYGHYKALFTHEGLDAVEAAWLNAPFHLGFSSRRSQRGLDIMLEKKAGVRNAEKLRAILLFEADYNTHAKVLSRQVMAQAERWLAPEQFGSRNRHNAISQALNKRLLFDYIRTNHYPTCWVFTDAKSCYDRIVHTPASLALQRMGLSKEAVSSLFDTIAKMRHYIRTGLGDAKSCYRSINIPFQGVGQGNGMGPCIWAVVSSVLFDAMRSAGFGVKIRTPITDKILELMGGGFVDDLDLFSIGDPCMGDEADVGQMQRGLDLWEELLRATGGAIEPLKSEWYRIDFTWKNGVATMRSHDPAVSELTCLDHTQTRRSLTLKQVHQGSKTLGVILAPDGGKAEAIIDLRKAAELCGDYVRLLRLPGKDLLQTIQARFMKKLQYPILVTSFSEADCTRIMSPLLEAILSALGLCRKLPRDIVYGPRSHQGVGLTNLYTMQAVQQVMFILSESNRVCRHMLQTSIELTLLEAGIPGPLFMQPYCPYVSKTWVSSAWKMARMYLDLEMDDGIVGLSLRCHQDCYLMRDFATCGRFSTSELGHINRCRLFLKVYCLSDITNGDGSYLAKWAWDGEGAQRHRPNLATWPYQVRPGSKSWTLWRKALRYCYASSLRDPLVNPLGAWSTKDHLWCYSSSTGKLYSLGYQYSRIRGTFCYKVPVTEVPSDVQPAIVYRKGRGEYILDGYRPYHAPASEPTWDTSWAFIESRPESLKWALRDCEGLHAEAMIRRAIQAGHCVVVSDGSFQASFSTAAYIITSSSPEDVGSIEGQCIVPGRHQSAFRAELGGIYAALNMLLVVVSRAPVPVSGTVIVGCDGKAALDRLRWARKEAKGSHFDLVSGIVHCCKELEGRNLQIKWEHIRGHQDRVVGHVLTELEELNVLVDRRAQQYNAQCREEGFQPMDGDVYGEIGPMWMDLQDQGRIKITNGAAQLIHDTFHASRIKAYWEEKSAISSSNAVDWEVLSKANSRRSVAQHMFTVKRVSGYIGVRKWLYRWKQGPSASCLLCGAEQEDMSHVYKCPDERVDETWALEVAKISSWVETSTNSALLSEFIRLLLMAYRATGPPDEPPGEFVPAFQQLWREQWDMGDNSLLNGFLSLRWRGVVEGMTGTIRSTTWLSKLTIQLYEFGGVLWGKRNELVNQEPGSRTQLAQQAVALEVARGSEGQARVEALLQEGSVPTDNSSLGYMQMWLVSIQVARATILSQEERERSSRQIMHNWLRGGGSRRSDH